MTRPTVRPARSKALSNRNAFSSIVVRAIFVQPSTAFVQAQSRIRSAECAFTPMQSSLSQRYSPPESLTTDRATNANCYNGGCNHGAECSRHVRHRRILFDDPLPVIRKAEALSGACTPNVSVRYRFGAVTNCIQEQGGCMCRRPASPPIHNVSGETGLGAAKLSSPARAAKEPRRGRATPSRGTLPTNSPTADPDRLLNGSPALSGPHRRRRSKKILLKHIWDQLFGAGQLADSPFACKPSEQLRL